MKRGQTTFCVAVFAAISSVGAVLADDRPACHCGVAIERDSDFYWENDKFGMRAYGPGDAHRWSGLDVFNKLERSASVGEILHHPGRHGNWHETPSSGVLDNYAVGAGRGLGGVAIFADGEWKTYPNWTAFKILQDTPEVCEFILTYPACSQFGKMRYHITLRKGDAFFKNTVTFDKPFKGAIVGPGLDLSEARGHAGEVFEDEAKGIVALYEKDKGLVEAATMTAVFIDPADAHDVKLTTDHLGCRILAMDGSRKSFTYWAGARWSRRGEYRNLEEWKSRILRFRQLLTEK